VTPTLRHAAGEDALALGDLVCFPEGAVVIRIPGGDSLRFRLADQIDDYWDGEPGAGPV
jgi:hypothetical protein